jgi:CRP/FNR family transcriptional regulator, dissimilatory nitrate respiration regulator
MTSIPTLKALRDLRFAEGVVSSLSLFSEISRSQLAAVARHCWTLSARRGDTLVSRGERLAGVYALAYGSVKLALRGADNEERVLRLVGAGQTFGEAASVLGRCSGYEALALVDSRLIVIPSAAILGLIDRDPRFARSMVKRLAERTFDLLAELETATMRRGAQRLASYLDSLAEPAAGASSCAVQLPVSKTLVAARLGVKKETLSRLLRQFTDHGVITVSRREIAILDRQRLAAFAGAS